jgi:hypothetical protein
MRCKHAPRNDAHFNIVCPKVLVEAVRHAAAQHLQSANAYARGALLKRLEADGVRLKETKVAA